MSDRPQRPVTFLVLAIAGAVLLICAAAFLLYGKVPRVEEVAQRLLEVQVEYRGIKEFVSTNADALNDALTDYLQSGATADLARYEKANQNWQRWLEAQRRSHPETDATAADTGAGDAADNLPQPVVTVEQAIVPLLHQVAEAYTNYTKAAQFLLNNPDAKGKAPAHLTAANRARTRLWNLSQQARMRADAIESVRAAAQSQIGWLQSQVRGLSLVVLLALVGFCSVLVVVLYRRKVVETWDLLREQRDQQRQQQAHLDKLTHFERLAQELAHEIKQPLTAINARLYTLQKTLTSGSDPHKDSVVIRSEMKRLDHVVRDFLQLARPAEPNLVPIEARDALGEIRELMGSQLEQQGVELKFDCEEDARFRADLPQLKQILINLVQNAAECLDDSGTVTLRGRKASRSLHGKVTDTVILEVADTGPGIPPDIEQRIFDPFFSTKEDGTGLGLAIASRMIGKHRGVLEFDTELGKGTTFRVVLPACDREAK